MDKLTDKQWLQIATQFTVDERDGHDKIYIESRSRQDGTRKWVVYNKTYVLGKDGKWHYEPLPSNRDDEFLELTRFDTPQDAHDAWKKSEKL